jgi:hypothetical protein
MTEPDPQVARLTEIARTAYEQPGKLGHQPRLIMAVSTRDAIAGVVGPPRGEAVWAVPHLTWARLTAIPIYLDQEIPHGAWRLLDDDGREIERGGYPTTTLAETREVEWLREGLEAMALVWDGQAQDLFRRRDSGDKEPGAARRLGRPVVQPWAEQRRLEDLANTHLDAARQVRALLQTASGGADASQT